VTVSVLSTVNVSVTVFSARPIADAREARRTILVQEIAIFIFALLVEKLSAYL
jgi:hypothetical protein